ncbi:DUF6768 family protein [Jejuia spongiicola]|uniref:Uncharacterized protein n=1 Tax=Jejuia spongiicola TaxID=2942207 RepID=A0ABT0QG98_9FLAO|nr:DUF6768 family protein [Jejuia spongiicola]MCL6296011.1 hypothetical protein [Jejuia spongiicola]
MKNNIEDIDKLIKETLTQEETKFYDDLDEQNPLQMVGGLFQGKLKWFMILVNIVMIAWFALFVYCTIQFFKVETTSELIKWAAIGFFSMMVIGMLKLFSWMQMDKNAIMRELKRLELQISSLHHKIK